MIWGDVEEIEAILSHISAIDLGPSSDGAAAVGSAIDEWLIVGGYDVSYVARSVRFHPTEFRRGGAAASLLLLHFGSLNATDHALPELKDALRAATEDGKLDKRLTKYAKARMATIVSEASAACLRDSRSILEFLGSEHVEVRPGRVIVDEGVILPLDEVVRNAEREELGLWRLLDHVSSGRDVLGQEIAAQWASRAPAVERGLRDLFHARTFAHPQPRTYLASFPRAAAETGWIDIILDELARRESLRDGFRDTAPPSAWLDALGTFSVWMPGQVAALACLRDLRVGETVAYFGCLKHAISSVWERNRSSGSFGALSMLRHARWLTQSRRALDDRNREEECTDFLNALDGGTAVIELHQHMLDLPMGVSGERDAWRYLDDRAKARWRWRVEQQIGTNQDLRRGFVEFALTWLSRDVYADVDPVVIDLVTGGDASYVVDDDDVRILTRMAQSRLSPGYLRADTILAESEFRTLTPSGHRDRL